MARVAPLALLLRKLPHGTGAMPRAVDEVRTVGLQPGRPVTTGSSSTKRVVFRVTAVQRATLEAEAKRLGLTSADAAAKLRCFPKPG